MTYVLHIMQNVEHHYTQDKKRISTFLPVITTKILNNIVILEQS